MNPEGQVRVAWAGYSVVESGVEPSHAAQSGVGAPMCMVKSSEDNADQGRVGRSGVIIMEH